MQINDYEILIKTFERPNSLIRLLKSIPLSSYNIKIRVADDSKKSYKDKILKQFSFLQIYYYELPFDSGLSYGRNFLLSKVETDYFILMDDDFALDSTFSIDSMVLDLMTRKLDILGGHVRNFQVIGTTSNFRLLKIPFQFINLIIMKILDTPDSFNFIGKISINEQNINIKMCLKCFPDYIETDFVTNFFVAKTSSVRFINGWDTDLKLQEHMEFFIRCKKGKLKIGYSNKYSANHYRSVPKNYKKYRIRDFSNLITEKHGVIQIRSQVVDQMLS